MVKDLVSVIIPVYNRENVIEECVNSVFAQIYRNFEIVIVDDGSTDSTYDICKHLAQKDERIKLFAGEHGGVSAARNMALDKADGEYVFFLDSDDVIYPLLLETLVSEMKESDAGIAGTRVVNVSESRWDKVREKIAEAPVAGQTKYLTNEEALYSMFHGDSPLSCIGGVMMKKELVGDTKFKTDLFIGEDYYFIYENLIKGASCVFLEPKWYYARNHATNSSWNYTFDGFTTRFYRRELVWKSEEALGREEFANVQKRDAFSCFVTCAKRNTPYSMDSKRMRKVMKQYRKEICPALSSKAKIMYFICMHFPVTASMIFKKK